MANKSAPTGINRIMPLVIIGIFIVFAGTVLGFVYFAMGHKVDLVSEQYYERGVAYDDHLGKVKNARALRQGLKLEYTKGDEFLRLQFPPNLARMPEGSIQLYRPSDSDLDRKFAIATDANGRQDIAVRELTSGYWKLQVEWQSDSTQYFDSFNIRIP